MYLHKVHGSKTEYGIAIGRENQINYSGQLVTLGFNV